MPDRAQWKVPFTLREDDPLGLAVYAVGMSAPQPLDQTMRPLVLWTGPYRERERGERELGYTDRCRVEVFVNCDTLPANLNWELRSVNCDRSGYLVAAGVIALAAESAAGCIVVARGHPSPSWELSASLSAGTGTIRPSARLDRVGGDPSVTVVPGPLAL